MAGRHGAGLSPLPHLGLESSSASAEAPGCCCWLSCAACETSRPMAWAEALPGPWLGAPAAGEATGAAASSSAPPPCTLKKTRSVSSSSSSVGMPVEDLLLQAGSSSLPSVGGKVAGLYWAMLLLLASCGEVGEARSRVAWVAAAAASRLAEAAAARLRWRLRRQDLRSALNSLCEAWAGGQVCVPAASSGRGPALTRAARASSHPPLGGRSRTAGTTAPAAP